MLSEAGPGAEWCAGSQGLRVILGFPVAQLLTVITAHGVGAGGSAAGESRMGNTPWPVLVGLYSTPWHPRNGHRAEGTARDALNGPVLLRRPRPAYPA